MPFEPNLPLSVVSSRRPNTPIIRVTEGLRQLYQNCNPQKPISHNFPRRCLTKPSKGVYNDNIDNEQHDYILKVNDILSDDKGNHFTVLDLLGTGTFGQVVKCRYQRTGEEVAVKVIKNQRAYFNQAWVEINILRMLHNYNSDKDTKHIVKFHSYFIFREHLCLVFEKLGLNLYELLKRNKFHGLNLDMVRNYLNQILQALEVLLRSEVIHCDLKPENILLQEMDLNEVKIIDFGSACQLQHPVYSYVQSRFYRSPEILLGANEYNSKIDMWSLGCVAGELFLGIPLFPGQNEMNMISRIVEMLGDIPDAFLRRCQAEKRSKFFNVARTDFVEDMHVFQLKSVEQFERDNGTSLPKWKRFFKKKTLRDIILSYPYKTQEPHTEEIAQRECLIDLIRGMLKLDPRERWTPSEALDHPFLRGVPLPGGRPWVPPTRPYHVMGSRPVAIDPHDPEFSPIDALYSASAPNYTAKGSLMPSTTWGMGAGGKLVPRQQGFPVFQAQAGTAAFSYGDTNVNPALQMFGSASYAPPSRLSLGTNLSTRGQPINSPNQGVHQGNWRGSVPNNEMFNANGVFSNDQRNYMLSSLGSNQSGSHGFRVYGNSSENTIPLGSTPPRTSTAARRIAGGLRMSGSRESLTNPLRMSSSRESLGIGRVSSTGDMIEEMMFPMISDDESMNSGPQAIGQFYQQASHSYTSQTGLSPRGGFGNTAALPPPGPKLSQGRSGAAAYGTPSSLSSYGYTIANQQQGRFIPQRFGQQINMTDDVSLDQFSDGRIRGSNENSFVHEPLESLLGNTNVDGMQTDNNNNPIEQMMDLNNNENEYEHVKRNER